MPTSSSTATDRLDRIAAQLKAQGVVDVKFTLAPGKHDRDRVADDLAKILQSYIDGKYKIIHPPKILPMRAKEDSHSPLRKHMMAWHRSGVNATFSRRKLASGKKAYFVRLRGKGGHSWAMTALDVVRDMYPHAYLSSGHFGDEFDCMVRYR